jgi:phospholipase/carboxylesterase
LARQAYQDGEYKAAARFYLALLRYDIGDADNIYNLACCYGLLDEPRLAAFYLERAFNAGWDDTWQINHDPDFDAVRDRPVFQELMTEMEGKLDEAKAEMGQRVFFKSEVYLRGRVYFPEEYDPQQQYPVIIGLHGFGSHPDRFVKLWKRFAEVDFIFVVPQAPYAFMSSLDDPGYSWGGWLPGEALPTGAWPLSEQYIGSVIDDVARMYNASEIYLLGFSQGSGIALTAGVKQHKRLTGIICFGGWLDRHHLTDDELEAAKHLRVFIAHGNEDAIVEFSSGEETRDGLAEFDFDVTFHEFGGGHTVPAEALEVVSEWLQAGRELPEEEET